MRTVSDLIGDEYLNWKPGIPYVLSSQTGRGKTTFVMTRLLRNAAAQNRDVLYICNRKALHAQVEQIISNMMQEIKSAFSLTEEESRHLIIQTYQYYEAGTINPFYFSKVLYVIFDEAHYFLEDASFNSGTNLWSDWIKEFYKKTVYAETPICVFMTATPEPLKCFLAMNYGSYTFSGESILDSITSANRFISKWYNRIKDYEDEFYNCNRISNNESKKDIRKRLLKEFPQISTYECAIRDKDIYGEGKTKIQTALNSNCGILEFCDNTDYSYIDEYYFREYSELIDKICKSKEKWIIFINNSAEERQYAQQLNDLGIETVVINSHSKNTEATQQLKQLESQQSFSCRVLISTSVLDCGVNIIDDEVQNIVIFEIEKTTFIQMLGRVRVRAGLKVRLFIKAPNALEIRDAVKYTCRDIQTMYNFHMLQKNEVLEKNEVFYYKPVMSMVRRRRFLQNMKGSNYKIIYFKHDLLTGYNWVNKDIKDAWNNGTILAEYEMNFNLLVYLLYKLYCFDQAKAYTQEGKADDIYYLKYQLSWLGKEYDERRWVSHTQQRNKIIAFLDKYLNKEDGMISEEQDSFAAEIFELLRSLSVIPSAAKQNRSALKRNNRSPGKNILNKCFEEIGIPYVITSKSKMQNGKREQRWYVKRRDAENEKDE